MNYQKIKTKFKNRNLTFVRTNRPLIKGMNPFLTIIVYWSK